MKKTLNTIKSALNDPSDRYAEACRLRATGTHIEVPFTLSDHAEITQSVVDIADAALNVASAPDPSDDLSLRPEDLPAMDRFLQMLDDRTAFEDTQLDPTPRSGLMLAIERFRDGKGRMIWEGALPTRVLLAKKTEMDGVWYAYTIAPREEDYAGPQDVVLSQDKDGPYDPFLLGDPTMIHAWNPLHVWLPFPQDYQAAGLVSPIRMTAVGKAAMATIETQSQDNPERDAYRGLYYAIAERVKRHAQQAFSRSL